MPVSQIHWILSLVDHFAIIRLFMKFHENNMENIVKYLINATREVSCEDLSPLFFFVCWLLLIKMSSIEDRYYKLNRFWLKILGIWPYQNSKWAYVQTIIIRSLYLSGIFVQVILYSLLFISCLHSKPFIRMSSIWSNF